MARVLGRVRLSRVTDASTSVERQREIITKWCEMHSHSLIGWAEDVDFSRSIRPFEAPEFGKWLNDPIKVAEWDIVAGWRLDRYGAGSINMNELFGWCQNHGKTLVSVVENLDLSTWVGRMVANVLAGLAEGDLEAMRDRNKNAFDFNIRAGKYRGGNPPFGYRPTKIDGEWRYVPDPKMADLARSIVGRLLDGETLSSIVRDLNDRGVMTPQDHFRVAQGKAPKGSRWAVSNLARELESPTLLGQVVVSEAETDTNGQPIRKNGKKVYGPKQVMYVDGKPLTRSDPILNDADFKRVKEIIGDRKGTPRRNQKSSNALLLQVLFCGVCGKPMYRLPGRSHIYYRCAGAAYQSTCGNKTVRMDDADALITDVVMDLLGDLEHMVPVFDPGEDVAQEIENIDAKLSSLAAGVSRFPEGPALDSLLLEVDALNSRRTELKARPHRPAGYRYEPTGKTFREYWTSLDAPGKNLYLRDHGVRAEFKKTPGTGVDWHVTFGDIPKMVAAINPDKAGQIRSELSYPEILKVIS